MPTQPTLGYGEQSEATLDQVNTWMRSTPWYQSLLRSWGQDPQNVHLSDAQKQQVVRAAQANGVVVDEGKQEVDDSGNFANQGHGLRNTLIVAGIAAAAIATMGAAGVFGGAAAAGASGASGAAAGALPAGVTLEGTAAGLGGASTAVGSGALASTATAPTVGGLAAGGTGLAAGAGGAGGGAVAGVSYGDLLKYGLPVAGNLVGGIIQAKATGSASDAQQRYLEEALAYQKEQDAYARTTDATRYADQRALDATALAKADQRYGDYQGRIAGFIGNGSSANDRMAALLGLPARAPGAGPSGSGSSGGSSQGVPVTPDITAKLTDYYRSQGLTPTGPGTGPTDIAYMAKQIAATGGLTPGNVAYWLDPSDKGRITQELTKAGVKYGAPAASPSSPSAPVAPPAASAPAAAASVQMRAPDGSLNRVSADQVAHYQQLGATVIGAAA